ncbi:MAG: YihA family ribosome biogenesis GTP-binding protein [Gammaproteobacteria bacterium]|nr:MAG: YihA family ribosome biogenesis GTP-binding protein [Gammaproteobacteria bacterium]
MKTLYKNCTFVKSAAALSDCPDAIREVAFAGRSNAGKSSALNYLTNKKIAKTSKTPGRTQLINFFSIAEGYYLVDLPGYGYAKVSRDTRKKWQRFIADYLVARRELVGIIVVMDCRHPLQEIDCMMLDFCAKQHLLAHILLTKADKLSRNQQMQTLQILNKNLHNEWPFATAQLFSATKKMGAETLTDVLNNWLFSDASD